MVKVNELSDLDLELLENGYKNDIRHHFRERCKGMLLSNENYSVTKIALILKKQKDTIYGWIKAYNSLGIDGLENSKGQGVKAKLDNITKDEEKRLKDLVDREAQNLKKTCAILSVEFGFKVTKWMLVHYIKKNGIILGEGLENG